jgi:rRNA maturation endonuclease Nob1
VVGQDKYFDFVYRRIVFLTEQQDAAAKCKDWNAVCRLSHAIWELLTALDRHYAMEDNGAECGVWTHTHSGVRCSHCGRVYDPTFEAPPSVVKSFKWCPSCGAFMHRKETDNG